MVWDAKGNLWKEFFTIWAPVKLADGQEVIGPQYPTAMNVQSGRVSVLNQGRSYNNGYHPNMFTLQTVQTVMRGGALR
jgi:hypothetical protein